MVEYRMRDRFSWIPIFKGRDGSGRCRVYVVYGIDKGIENVDTQENFRVVLLIDCLAKVEEDVGCDCHCIHELLSVSTLANMIVTGESLGKAGLVYNLG